MKPINVVESFFRRLATRQNNRSRVREGLCALFVLAALGHAQQPSNPLVFPPTPAGSPGGSKVGYNRYRGLDNNDAHSVEIQPGQVMAGKSVMWLGSRSRPFDSFGTAAFGCYADGGISIVSSTGGTTITWISGAPVQANWVATDQFGRLGGAAGRAIFLSSDIFTAGTQYTVSTVATNLLSFTTTTSVPAGTYTLLYNGYTDNSECRKAAWEWSMASHGTVTVSNSRDSSSFYGTYAPVDIHVNDTFTIHGDGVSSCWFHDGGAPAGSAWNSGTAYVTDQFVTSGGHSWLALQASTNKTPTVDATSANYGYWRLADYNFRLWGSLASNQPFQRHVRARIEGCKFSTSQSGKNEIVFDQLADFDIEHNWLSPMFGAHPSIFQLDRASQIWNWRANAMDAGATISKLETGLILPTTSSSMYGCFTLSVDANGNCYTTTTTSVASSGGGQIGIGDCTLLNSFNYVFLFDYLISTDGRIDGGESMRGPCVPNATPWDAAHGPYAASSVVGCTVGYGCAFGGRTYQCNLGGTCAASAGNSPTEHTGAGVGQWTAIASPGKFIPYGPDNWSSGTTYATGDLSILNNLVWRCDAGCSGGGQTPGGTGWTAIEFQPYPGCAASDNTFSGGTPVIAACRAADRTSLSPHNNGAHIAVGFDVTSEGQMLNNAPFNGGDGTNGGAFLNELGIYSFLGNKWGSDNVGGYTVYQAGQGNITTGYNDLYENVGAELGAIYSIPNCYVCAIRLGDNTQFFGGGLVNVQGGLFTADGNVVFQAVTLGATISDLSYIRHVSMNGPLTNNSPSDRIDTCDINLDGGNTNLPCVFPDPVVITPALNAVNPALTIKRALYDGLVANGGGGHYATGMDLKPYGGGALDGKTYLQLSQTLFFNSDSSNSRINIGESRNDASGNANITACVGVGCTDFTLTWAAGAYGNQSKFRSDLVGAYVNIWTPTGSSSLGTFQIGALVDSVSGCADTVDVPNTQCTTLHFLTGSLATESGAEFTTNWGYFAPDDGGTLYMTASVAPRFYRNFPTYSNTCSTGQFATSITMNSAGTLSWSCSVPTASIPGGTVGSCAGDINLVSLSTGGTLTGSCDTSGFTGSVIRTACTTITGGVPTGCSNVTEIYINGKLQ